MQDVIAELISVPAVRAADGRTRRGFGRWIVLALLSLALAVTLFPFVLAVMNAFKTPPDYVLHGPLSLPAVLDFTAVVRFWTSTNFTQKLINSAFISGTVAIGGVILSLLNAYAFGIGRVKGSRVLLALLLLGIMAPQEALMYPLYFFAKAAHLYDNQLAVILVFTVLHSTFGTYLLSAVLTAFPREIVEAARIDGASRLQLLLFIVVPILRPTLTVLATFFFIWTWNEFLLPLILLPSDGNQTVSVAFGALNGQYVKDETATAAAALLGIAPTIIFFLIFQRTLTRGVVVGAVK